MSALTYKKIADCDRVPLILERSLNVGLQQLQPQLVSSFVVQVHNETYGPSNRSREKFGSIEPFLTPDLTRRQRKENSHCWLQDQEDLQRPKSALSLSNFQKFKDATR